MVLKYVSVWLLKGGSVGWLFDSAELNILAIRFLGDAKIKTPEEKKTFIAV